MASSSTSLYNVEIESSAIACLLQYPEVFADFSLISPSDFSEINRDVFSVIQQQLNQTPPASVSPMIVSERMKGFGLTDIKGVEGGLSPFDYLSGLQLRFVEKTEAAGLAKELKRYTVRRELVVKMRELERKLVTEPNATFEQMTGVVEKGISSVATDYYKPETTPLFSDIIEVTEERGNNPIKVEEMGLMGPFPTLNKTLGALLFPGAFTTIGARTGNQKSSLGFFYNLFVAEKYNLPLLLLDAGEMTKARLQRRAICCMSQGRIPLWAIASGEWRANKEWTQIIRDDIWPRVRKIKMDFISVGGRAPHEKVSFIKRYYYNKIGRGNHLLIFDDYLKGVEAVGKNTSEYQAVGYYVENIKNLITDDITASFWTAVQNNRQGSYMGKKAHDIVDTDANMGLSDRIIQQSDWGFILRYKVPEEMAVEKQLFGNMMLKPVKMREAMGKDFEKTLKPVKLKSGKFTDNYFNIESKNFHFTEKGDLRYVLETLGDVGVDMTGHGATVPNPI